MSAQCVSGNLTLSHLCRIKTGDLEICISMYAFLNRSLSIQKMIQVTTSAHSQISTQFATHERYATFT